MTARKAPAKRKGVARAREAGTFVGDAERRQRETEAELERLRDTVYRLEAELDEARVSTPFGGFVLLTITDAYLSTLTLAEHQRPIAELARTLARKIDSPDEFTAAAADQFRRTLALLIPVDALRHQTKANAERIKRAPRQRKTAVDDTPKPGKKKPGSRAVKRAGDAGVSAAPLAARIRDGGPRARR